MVPRVVGTVRNALYLGAQGGVAWQALAWQRVPISAGRPARSARSASSAPRKLLQINKKWQRCRYRILRLQKCYRRKSDRFTAKSLSTGSPKSTPQTKISGHVVRRCRLLPRYNLGNLPKAKGSPTFVCPKAAILLAGFSMAGSHVLELPLHRFGWCFNDILT
jgi:hypothetical protein